MSRIVIFGGTGYSGSAIAREAVARGNSVVSYSRHAPTAEQHVDGVEYRIGALEDDAALEQAASDADELVITLHSEQYPGGLPERIPTLITTAIRHDVRLSFVGGSASAFATEGGGLVIDSPQFNPEWRPEAEGHAKVLDILRKSPAALRWFYVSPTVLYGSYAPGEVTGSYRIGGDVVVTAADGTSLVSAADLALAYLDEIEHGTHPRQRFTVGR